MGEGSASARRAVSVPGRALLCLLALGGCWLEKTTGQPVPLDPRFYQAVEKAQGDPGVGGGDAIPFASHDGDMVTIRGTITSPLEGAVDIDVRTPDPTAPGGVKGHGKMLVERPGPFSLEVPAGLGSLELQAFQDPEANGPGGEDPFAQVQLTVEDEDLDGILFELEPGARGTSGGPQHQEAAPGAPGGDPGNAPPRPPDPGGGAGPQPEPQPGQPGEPPPDGGGSGQPPPGPGGAGPSPFADMTGQTVVVSGMLVLPAGLEAQGKIDVDLFQPDKESPGGRKMLGKLKLPAGAFSFDAPANFGVLLLEAFYDVNDNQRPDAGDAMGRAVEPLRISGGDVGGVEIALELSTDGRMPGDPERPPPPGGRSGL